MSDEKFKLRNGRLTAIIIGAALGIAVTLIFLFIFAAAIYFFDIDRVYSVPFATMSLALGSFSAAYFVSKKIGHRGYLIGALVGLISFAVVTIISLIVTKSGFSGNTVFYFIIIVIASLIGGILGVNKGKRNKYI
ncbi:MAG: TIGR04086 family membrane protein [Clostridia bacterium]|nr:TIGR04086 family membrane protein [Clostridia bacterium]